MGATLLSSVVPGFILPVGICLPAVVVKRIYILVNTLLVIAFLKLHRIGQVDSVTDVFEACRAFRLTTVCPSLARLVLMMITPLASRTPKIASDEGAFNISIVSIFADFRILSGTTCVYNLYAGYFSLNGCPAGW